MNSDETYMRAALDEAAEAALDGEIPVGAVIVRDGRIISRAHNLNRSGNDPVLHAEILAIREAAGLLKNERLTGCDLYVTKEPCAMCAGAIIHARIERVIIGATDTKYGACGTVLTVCGDPRLNHVPEIRFGILGDEAALLLSEFFQGIRRKNK